MIFVVLSFFTIQIYAKPNHYLQQQQKYHMFNVFVLLRVNNHWTNLGQNYHSTSLNTILHKLHTRIHIYIQTPLWKRSFSLCLLSLRVSNLPQFLQYLLYTKKIRRINQNYIYIYISHQNTLCKLYKLMFRPT